MEEMDGYALFGLVKGTVVQGGAPCSSGSLVHGLKSSFKTHDQEGGAGRGQGQSWGQNNHFDNKGLLGSPRVPDVQ